MLYIDALHIDDTILEKIETKHGIEYVEVDETVFSPDRYVRRGREGLYKVFGRTDSGRYLLVILADRGRGVWSVVTARDMTRQERRLYQQAIGA